MNIQEFWEKALKQTRIIRPRVQPLETFKATHVPYVMLSASLINPGDTVVRKGTVVIEKPSIILPLNLPQFEGFEFEEEAHVDEEMLTNFLLVRGVTFPSLHYNNKTGSIEVFDGPPEKAISHYGEQFQRSEDVETGLVVGPEDAWQFSLLLFVGGQVERAAEGDIKRLTDDLRKKGWNF